MVRIARRLAPVAAALLVGCASAPPACPDGTVVVGAAPPGGQLRYCVRAAGEVQPIRHGPWQRWHDSGQLAEDGAWQTGRKHGLWTRFDAGGAIFEEITYRDGIPEGPWRRWYETGQVAEEGVFREGRRDGRWRTFYRSGQLRSDGRFRADQRDGEWVLYYADGTKQARGEFVGGVRGLGWREYKRDGTPRESPVLTACEGLVEKICQRLPRECSPVRARLARAVDLALTPSSMDQCRQILSDEGLIDAKRAVGTLEAGPR